MTAASVSASRDQFATVVRRGITRLCVQSTAIAVTTRQARLRIMTTDRTRRPPGLAIHAQAA